MCPLARPGVAFVKLWCGKDKRGLLGWDWWCFREIEKTVYSDSVKLLFWLVVWFLGELRDNCEILCELLIIL